MAQLSTFAGAAYGTRFDDGLPPYNHGIFAYQLCRIEAISSERIQRLYQNQGIPIYAMIHTSSPLDSDLALTQRTTGPLKLPSCSVCKDLNGEYFSRTQQSRQELMRAASSGCQSCSIILSGICKIFPGWINGESRVGHLDNFKFSGGFRGPLRVSLLDNSNIWTRGQNIEHLDFYVLPGERPPNEAFGNGTTVPKCLIECRSFIPRWMKNCIDNHPHCANPGDNNLPTRILDVSIEFGGSDCSDCFLYESQGERAPYVCLSHCWGGSKPLSSTTDSLLRMKQKIAWQDLPTTFQSAVGITRYLGIQYLWIDSLCIVQDDASDWEKESANMGQIYRDAILVIAGSASSGSEGLFYDRDDFREHFKIDGVQLNESFDLVNVRLSKDHGQFYALPLRRRAWTLQEEFLARRILHIHYDELVFECESDAVCCCSESSNVAKPKSRIMQSIRNGNATLEQIWEDMVEDYTKRSLTKDNDKLPAISGVAQWLQNIFQANYVAGLWMAFLVRGLCWYSNNGHRRAPEAYRAPSWSWASVEGPVEYPRPVRVQINGGNPTLPMGHMQSLSVQVLGVDCKPASLNPTGAVSSGYVRLYGKLITAIFHYNDGGFSCYKCEKDGVEEMFFADFSHTHSDTASKVIEGERIYCLELGLVCWPPEPPSKFRGLVLRQSRRDPRDFERIGLIVSSDHDSSKWFQGVQKRELTIW